MLGWGDVEQVACEVDGFLGSVVFCVVGYVFGGIAFNPN